MTDVLDFTPIAAAAFAVPQFIPQILKLRATRDTAGVSWPWATLTSLNNAAWIAYFALTRYWTALVPATSATLLAGTLAIMLAARGQAKPRPSVLISTWAAMLITAYSIAGRTGLGTLLTAAFILQVTPSIWTAYRTARPTGISAGTWMLILSELTCWMIFGVHKSDPRLITLGVTGVTASALMITRIHRISKKEQPASPRSLWRGNRSSPGRAGSGECRASEIAEKALEAGPRTPDSMIRLRRRGCHITRVRFFRLPPSVAQVRTLGFVTGFLAWLAYRPQAEKSADHVMGTFQMPWTGHRHLHGPRDHRDLLRRLAAREGDRQNPDRGGAGRPPARAERDPHLAVPIGIGFLVGAFLLLGAVGSGAGNGGNQNDGILEVGVGLVALTIAIVVVAPALLAVPVNIGSTGPGCPARNRLGSPLQSQPFP